MSLARVIACGIGLVLMSATAGSGGDVPGNVANGGVQVSGASLEALTFASLAGWPDDDHDAAFTTFLRSCRALGDGAPALRPAAETGVRLAAACEAALRWEGTARAYFERHFTPHRVLPETGRPFLTGYYEPEYDGAREADATFSAPLRARPSDHVRFETGETPPGWPEGLIAGRRTADGYQPYPDRAAIEDGALGDAAAPVVFLGHPAEAFIIHVQGSARIRLAEGGVMRVGYAGRNGHPYTSIGRLLVERGQMTREEMSLERLLGWLQDPQNEGAGARPDAREPLLHLLCRKYGASPAGRSGRRSRRASHPASQSCDRSGHLAIWPACLVAGRVARCRLAPGSNWPA